MELLQGHGCSLLAVALLLVLAVFSRLRRRGEQPPIGGSVFQQLLQYHPTIHDYNTRMLSKHRTLRMYFPLVPIFYTVDPANVEHILKNNFPNYVKGSYNYDKLEDLFGDGIFAVDGEKWRHQRKLASFDFSTRTLRDFSSAVFKDNAAKLAKIISRAPSRPFDLQDLLLKSAMDSIFKIGFGVELDSLSGSDKRGVAFARAFDDSNAIVSKRYLDPLWKMKRFLNVGLERAHKENLRLIDGFVGDIIRSKLESNCCPDHKEKRRDMLSRFLEESARDPEMMTHKYLRDIMLNFMIAGKDTTAGTLAWFFYMLCKHPSTQEKVVEDINGAMGTTGSDAGFEEFASSITEEALERMHYLHAALSETLRLYPAVPVDIKVCCGDDTLPDGFKLYKGDIVAYSPYSMGRMSFLWGEDAEVFRPERWLDEEGRFRPESYFKFTAFQAGPRICLGKEFAYRQMKIFAAVLLRFFSFSLGDEHKDVCYKTMLTLHIDGGLHVRSSPR